MRLDFSAESSYITYETLSQIAVIRGLFFSMTEFHEWWCQEICLSVHLLLECFSVRRYLLLKDYLFTLWMENDKFGLVRVNSKLVCIKPRWNIQKLLINSVCSNSQVFFRDKTISVISKRNEWDVQCPIPRKLVRVKYLSLTSKHSP